MTDYPCTFLGCKADEGGSAHSMPCDCQTLGCHKFVPRAPAPDVSSLSPTERLLRLVTAWRPTKGPKPGVVMSFLGDRYYASLVTYHGHGVRATKDVLCAVESERLDDAIKMLTDAFIATETERAMGGTNDG